jgi:hypothetical protein
MTRHNTMVTTIFESALRVHAHRINDTCLRIRHAARLQCIRLVADQKATHPRYDFAALRKAWDKRDDGLRNLLTRVHAEQRYRRFE